MDQSNDRRPTKLVTIFCDGSSVGNGRDAARAAAVALLESSNLLTAKLRLDYKTPQSFENDGGAEPSGSHL